MKLRIFDTIKRFEDDFSYNIRSAFEEAADLEESRAIDRQAKIDAANKKKQEKEEQKEKKASNKLPQRNESIAMGSLLQQPNKIQTIRESSAVRPSYYPFQVGVAKKESKNTTQNLPL